MKVLITGGSGLVGRALCDLLSRSGIPFHSLTSHKEKGNPDHGRYYWDWKKGILDERALTGVDCVIHLAGANIGNKRWSKSYKEEILLSRTKSLQFLFQRFKETGHSPATLISAAAIGIYPDPGNGLMDENHPAGSGFLADVCRQWESATLEWKQTGTRVVILRTGIVLSNKGGLLPVMKKTLPLRVVPTTGSKGNNLGWIHIQDLAALYMYALQNTNMEGAYNAVAPSCTTQLEMARGIAEAAGIRAFHPNVPAFVLKWVLGERAILPLTHQMVQPAKTIATGFVYQFNELRTALSHLASSPEV
ncbi:MAG: TIGR01777 family oxidoreductase [Bacteroidetes bacterium]|nr:TIGR01777 family oxidoreductase [Bacteroidota bacterium]